MHNVIRHFFSIIAVCTGLGSIARPFNSEGVTNHLNTVPILFTENRGQIIDNSGQLRPDILFTAKQGGVRVFVTADGLGYEFRRAINPEGLEEPIKFGGKAFPKANTGTKTDLDYFKLRLVGANVKAKVSPEKKNAFYENFYLAHCPTGITNVSTYERIVLEDVYPGIDWAVYSNENGIKYDFIVHPGADPSQIKLRLEGDCAFRLTQKGELVINSKLGEVTDSKPISFSGGKEVATSFELLDSKNATFRIENYDKCQTLTMDPSIVWSTYYGGASIDSSPGVVPDKSGNLYTIGDTRSTSAIASSTGFQTALASFQDCFVVKFNNSGVRQWATYYGGSNYDYASSATFDTVGNLYFTLNTYSSGLATSGAYRTTTSGMEGCIVKFSTNGVRVWSTYFGDNADDYIISAWSDHSNSIYVSGQTRSPNGIATPGAFQTSIGGNEDGFLAKFNTNGSLLWCTYCGGSGKDWLGLGMCDSVGNSYVSGITPSSGMATSGSFQTSYGGGMFDGYLVKFNTNGVRQWASYVGGSDFDATVCVAVERNGNVYLGGSTKSSAGIASSGGYQPAIAGKTDLFLTKLTSSGARIWGTYYGGSDEEDGGAIVLAPGNSLYISGKTTSSSGIATMHGFQTINGGKTDGCLAKFDTSGRLIWGTYFGSSDDDDIGGCDVDSAGFICIAGSTYSTTGIATSNAHQTTFGGAQDLYLAKIRDGLRLGLQSGVVLCAGSQIALNILAPSVRSAGNVYTAQLSDSSGSFASATTIGSTISTASSTTILATLPASLLYGTGYRIRIISSNPADTDISNRLTIIPQPAPPTIVFSNDSLIASTDSVQWYGPAGLIPTAIGSHYKPTIPGNYYVTTKDSNGCPSAPSNVINVTSTMLGVFTAERASLIVYPNPADKYLVVDMHEVGLANVYSYFGQKLISDLPLKPLVNIIDVSSFSPGVYLLAITNANGELLTRQIQIQR